MNDDQISDLNAREEMLDYEHCAVCKRPEMVCRNGLRDDGDTHEYRPKPGRNQVERNERWAARIRAELRGEAEPTTDNAEEAT